MSTKPRLLIVEDDPEISCQLKWALAEEYDLFLAADAPGALKIMKTMKPPVVTLDLGLPPQPREAEVGLDLLQKMLEVDRGAKVVVVTGNDERENALRAIAQGAWDYYQKPIKIDELKVILSRAFHLHALDRENLMFQRELEEGSRLDELIGGSPEMHAIFARIRKVAASDVPVLIVGESGTGKELIARSIHNQSARRLKPFVPINCGAIPETLLEAEFFGHEKGAFTGAHIQRKGKVEYANGGVLFLDEIGELSPMLQVKLLRFLQGQTFERIGGRMPIEVDARIISATQRNLKEAITTGGFREDLYYRLGVVTIDVPPLRSRGNDILLLAHYFMRKTCGEMKRPTLKFSPGAIRALLDYEWPGNVRELENRIKRAVVMGEGGTVDGGDLELPCCEETPVKTLKEAREKLERDFLYEALTANNWNLARTAEKIGVTRPTLYDLIKKYKLERQECSQSGGNCQ
jgi:two-component system, NtrC family, response regulator